MHPSARAFVSPSMMRDPCPYLEIRPNTHCLPIRHHHANAPRRRSIQVRGDVGAWEPVRARGARARRDARAATFGRDRHRRAGKRARSGKHRRRRGRVVDDRSRCGARVDRSIDRVFDRSRSRAFPNVRPCVCVVVVKVDRPLYRVFLYAVGTRVLDNHSTRRQRRPPSIDES